MRRSQSGHPPRATRVRMLGAVTGAGIVLLAAAGAYELVRHDDHAPAAAKPVVVPRLLSEGAFQRASGVHIVRVAVSGAGGLVDLRFRVLDPDAAAGIHDAATPPQLVDERTNVLVNELLMGHAHHGRYKAAQTYYLIFNNPGNLVRRGSRVTVQLGAARVAHVLVR
jgi:hypothetical protein